MVTQEANENIPVNEHENKEEIKQQENTDQENIDQENKNQIENNQETEEKKTETNYSMNLVLLGGIVGAGVGYLTNPEIGRKVLKQLGESEFAKVAGNEFKRTAQDLLADQAQNSLKQLTVGYLNKLDEGLFSSSKEKGANEETSLSGEEDQTSRYEEIKEENKNLNDRLQRIEKMLNDLVESK
ncbi:YtxH domain-containing protein [Niallia sp. XMNu-256]|uniref:YtxH domain-containing protein n=1 Tax=Niallia sp. XMNu-256 TaxID=3082444 RepID=UPI0030D1191A